jgi:BirA family biotin operon repressor/biotin-[acetyl-CoA-carboxylase] ligase
MPKATNPFIILDSIDSTNNYAMGLLRSGSALSGLAVFAREQTAGKGRRGKVWKSNKNENIILSIVVNTRHLSVQNQFSISVVAALGAFDFFKKYSTEKSSIKWPNDLFWNDSKAGGILIENIIEGDLWQWSVIGIGINVNQIAFDNNKNAVSLKLITDQDFDVISLARELQVDVLARYDQLKTEGLEKMLVEYNKNLFRLNKKVKLRKGNIVFETLIIGVSEKGELLTKDALDRSFGFDEVAWVL